MGFFLGWGLSFDREVKSADQTVHIFGLVQGSQETRVFIVKNTIESQLFDVLRTRDFILKYQKFESYGGKHKNT